MDDEYFRVAVIFDNFEVLGAVRFIRRRQPKTDGVRIEQAGRQCQFKTAVLALPNLFLFARGTKDPAYLDRSDTEVLRDFAQFLGGDPAVLLPAWQCLQRDLATLPADLPARLERSALTSAAAALLPGGAARYLQILAAFVRARLAVLQACGQAPAGESVAVDALYQATAALIAWWRVHRYVFTGENGTDFQWEFTHPELLAPLQTWMKQLTLPRDVLILHAARRLSATGDLTVDQAARLLRGLG